MTPAAPIPIVLDTDIGTDVDDALALALALASPEVELIGVTVVDGDVDTRARMASRLLGMAGHQGVPVLVGEANPIGAGRMPTWFGHEGEGLLDEPWDGPQSPILGQRAAEWLVERSHETRYHLVAVGPFTNVARAVELDPTLPERVSHLTVMGGMVHAEHFDAQWRQFFAETGLPPNHMDHNTASDAEAALVMARAGFDTTWITAELTFCTTLDRAAVETFRASGSTLGDRLARLLEIWSTRWFHHIPNFPVTAKPFPVDAVAALHDPLALASVFAGDWLTIRPHNLRFAAAGELFEIAEIAQVAEADVAPGEPESPGVDARHEVSVGVDRARFAEIFVERVATFLSKVGPSKLDEHPPPSTTRPDRSITTLNREDPS